MTLAALAVNGMAPPAHSRPQAPAATQGERLEPDGLGWRWRIAELHVTLRVDFLHPARGELHGEICVETTLPGVPPLLRRETLNLSSGAARDRLARALAAKTPRAGINWMQLLENFTSGVIQCERRGEPVVLVGRLQGIHRTPDLIARLLVAGKANIWYGPGGSGKGWLATFAAVCHDTGTPLTSLKVQSGRTIYLDWEDSAETLDERVKAVAAGLGLDDTPEIAYRPCRRPLARDLHEIVRHVQEVGADLVIADSFEKASGSADGRTYEDRANEMLDAARLLEPATMLFIDHVNGEGLSAGAKITGKPFGSVFKLNGVRCAWEIRADQEPGSNVSRIGFYHVKGNHTARHQPIGFRLEFGPADDYGAPIFVRIYADDLSESDALSQNRSIPDRIAAELRDGARSYEQLYEALGDVGEPQIRMAVKRGLGKRFVRLEGGPIGLLQGGPAH